MRRLIVILAACVLGISTSISVAAAADNNKVVKVEFTQTPAPASEAIHPV